MSTKRRKKQRRVALCSACFFFPLVLWVEQTRRRPGLSVHEIRVTLAYMYTSAYMLAPRLPQAASSPTLLLT